MVDGIFYEELKPDARGFKTFMIAEFLDGELKSVKIDGVNSNDNPYGTFKSLSEKYNEDMHSESGTRYKDACKQIEKDLMEGNYPIERVKGARFLSMDANELFEKIIKKVN